MNMTATIIDIAGWLGAAFYIFPYLQLNLKKWDVYTPAYHFCNIIGSLMLTINTLYYLSYPAAFTNAFWGGIAIYGFMKYGRAKSGRLVASNRIVKSNEMVKSEHMVKSERAAKSR